MEDKATPLAEKQKFTAGGTRVKQQVVVFSGLGQLPKGHRSSSIRRNSGGVTGVSSGSACYQLVDFVATQFSSGIFDAHDNIGVYRDFKKRDFFRCCPESFAFHCIRTRLIITCPKTN